MTMESLETMESSSNHLTIADKCKILFFTVITVAFFVFLLTLEPIIYYTSPVYHTLLLKFNATKYCYKLCNKTV